MNELGKAYVGGTTVLLLGTAAAQGMMAAGTLLTARQLGTTAYGQYAACLAASGLLSVAFDLGLDVWLLREGAKTPALVQELLGKALLIKTVLGLPWTVGIVLLMPGLKPGSFPVPLMAASALAVWLDGLFMTGLAGLKALMKNQTAALFLCISRGTFVAGVLVLIWQGCHTPVVYVAVRTVASALGVLLSLRSPGTKLSGPHLRWLKQVGWETVPFALSALLATIYMRVDIAIVAVALDAQATGVYSAASKVISLLFFVPNTIYSASIPALVRALDKGHQARPTRSLLIVLAGFALAGSASWLGVWSCGGKLLPSLLGSGFAESGPIVVRLSPILFMKSLSFALAGLLVAGGWQYRRTAAQAVAALVNAGLNILVVRQYGVIGVAGVYLISELALLGGYSILGCQWWRAMEDKSMASRSGNS